MVGMKQIKKVSVADQLYENLKQLIIDGTWKPGDRIPTEMQIAEEYGVNRSSARVALQRLQGIGLIDIRVGDGTYVKEFDLCRNITGMADLYSDSVSQNELKEYRYYLEARCVRLAVQRRTEAELGAYLALLEQMSADLEKSFSSKSKNTAEKEILNQADLSLEIHAVLCSMAHNQMFDFAFALAKEPLRHLMLINVTDRITDKDSARNTIMLFHDLYDALLEKNEESAVATLKALINVDI